MNHMTRSLADRFHEGSGRVESAAQPLQLAAVDSHDVEAAGRRHGKSQQIVPCCEHQAGAFDSIACSGACLTVIAKTAHSFSVDISQESLRCTAGLDQLNAEVNLEKSLRLADVPVPEIC